MILETGVRTEVGELVQRARRGEGGEMGGWCGGAAGIRWLVRL